LTRQLEHATTSNEKSSEVTYPEDFDINTLNLKEIEPNSLEFYKEEEKKNSFLYVEQTLNDDKFNAESFRSASVNIINDDIQYITDEAFQSCDESENKANGITENLYKKKTDLDFETTSPINEPIK
ncbi:hypothetical protein MXB_1851, partial [Myxobolus squamalis]